MRMSISWNTPKQRAWVSGGIFVRTSISPVIANLSLIDASQDCYVRSVSGWEGLERQRWRVASG